MTNRWRDNWRDLFEQVLSTERCTGCSGCVVACPKKVLHLDRESWTPRLDSEAWFEDRAGDCLFGERGCTLCARACPRFGSWESEADLELWSRTRRVEEVLGVHRRILMVEATDTAIAGAGQDGGLGTAMLLFALDKGYIDGVLVSQYDDELRTQPGIARTRAVGLRRIPLYVLTESARYRGGGPRRKAWSCERRVPGFGSGRC